jgi:endonuclease G
VNKASLHSLLRDRTVLADLRDDFLVRESGGSSEVQRQLDLLCEGREDAIDPTRLTVPEAIIYREGRPALLIQDGRWEDARSGELRARLARSEQALRRAIPCVGRVEIRDHRLDYVGTGWMLDEDILVTNRHVAELFAAARGGGFSFMSDGDGRLLRVRVDFLREHERAGARRLDVAAVLFMESPGDARPDMALVRLARGADGLPAPIELDDAAVRYDGDVAVIGYPAEDHRNDLFAMREIFGRTYGVKRLSPGKVAGVRGDGVVFAHDCSTLGGNSGSPVINLATGRACGLHFAGAYMRENYAVSAAALKQRLSQLGRRTIALTRAELVPTTAQPEVRSAPELPRTGYDPAFLGDAITVPLPHVTAGAVADVRGRDDGELKYTHFSVKMRADRRIACFTACNIDGARLFNVPRGRDRWLAEPRLVDPAHQTDASLYAGNALDRGHLVRRLDPAWGDSRAEALQAIADTFVFTNCAPQHARLNQRTWLELEDYVLENAATYALKVSVFTGPILRDDDRLYRGVRLPEAYWKVVVIVNAFTGRPSATAYLLSQAEELGDLEFAYGEFRTHQVPVTEIEARTGLDFGRLRNLDPLGGLETRARRLITGPEDLAL